MSLPGAQNTVNGRLSGRVALVTGGARGQGAAHARRLGVEGATVIVGDVLVEEVEKTAAELAGEGLDVHAVALDVADPSSWRQVRALIEERHEVLDVLVNNAGVIHETRLEDEELDAWNRLLSINLTGVFLGISTMLPLLRASKGASVVNTASIYGPSGAPGYLAYGASKSGVLGITRTAALELADAGIRVNALVPGGVNTAMVEDPESGVVSETPLRRRAECAELAAAVAFLASDDASFITGTELVVDGGFSAR